MNTAELKDRIASAKAQIRTIRNSYIPASNGWCYMQGWIRKETISSRYSANARTKLE